MFNLMNEHTFDIENDEATPEFVSIGAGITSAEPNFNEETTQDKYFNGNGFGETDVVGAQLVISFSGHRKYGDPAQDYIFGKALTLGTSRRTNFKWTEPDGGIFEGDATIANISGPSGEAAAKGEVSFEIHFNGEPTYTPPV